MKGLVFKHYLRRSLTEPIGIGIITGLPTILIVILSMVMMGVARAEGTEFMVNGYNMIASQMAVMFMISFQFFGGNALLDYLHQDFRGDRRWRMFSLPVRDNDYVLGSLAACLVYCVVQGGLVIGITAIFLDVYWGNPLVLIATLFACAGSAQLIWMLLFMLFPKKSTVEASGQIITWSMMFASGYLGTVSGGNAAIEQGAVWTFLTSYGTPISLARNAITNSGFVGNDMNNALLCLGILYAFLVILAAMVAFLVKKKGFSPGKNTVAASIASTPIKGLGGAKTKAEPKIQDVVDISKQTNLILTTPSADHGGQFTIYKFALLRACRNPLSLILNAALPLVLVCIPGLWQSEAPMGFSFIGMAIMYGSFVAARSILNDKMDGTITRIFTSPVTSLRYLSQNLLAAITPLAAQILLVGIIGYMLYGWEIGFTVSLVLLYLLFAAASVAFSFAWSCLFKEKETSYAVFSVLTSIIAMLGGFFIPLSILPDALRYIGALFPAFWLSNGLLNLGGSEMAWGSYPISAAVIVMFAVLYMVFGSKRRIV